MKNQKNQNPFKDFIEHLNSLDGIGEEEKDEIFKLVDEYIAKWIIANFPDFHFQPEIRDFMVRAFRKATLTGMEFPLYAYCDAVLNMLSQRASDPLSALRGAMMFGWAFRDLSKKPEESSEESGG